MRRNIVVVDPMPCVAVSFVIITPQFNNPRYSKPVPWCHDRQLPRRAKLSYMPWTNQIHSARERTRAFASYHYIDILLLPPFAIWIRHVPQHLQQMSARRVAAMMYVHAIYRLNSMTSSRYLFGMAKIDRATIGSDFNKCIVERWNNSICLHSDCLNVIVCVI